MNDYFFIFVVVVYLIFVWYLYKNAGIKAMKNRDEKIKKEIKRNRGRELVLSILLFVGGTCLLLLFVPIIWNRTIAFIFIVVGIGVFYLALRKYSKLL